MAIALDTSSALLDEGTLTSATTYAYTVTGSNPVLFLLIEMHGQTADLVTGVTYNSVAMSRLGYLGSQGNGRELWLYVLSAPATGAHNVQISYSADGALGSVFATSYTGAATFSGASLDNSTTKTDTSTATSTASITTVASNCWTVIASQSEFVSVISAGTGTTSRQGGTTTTYNLIGDSNAAVSGATSMTVTSSGLDTLKSIIASFAPSGGVTATWDPGMTAHLPMGRSKSGVNVLY